MEKQPIDVLKQYWGYDAFRPMQEQIIQSALDRQDTLALLPTGGGKSICFQVPALYREGMCIVISPLIALMKDQVYNLQRRGIAAAAIFSGMSSRDIDRTFDNCVFGGVKLLYVSPERLTTDMARERIQRMQVNLLAVDEAHCVSQWGYDFRPPYLQIPLLRELIPDVPILALTATATPEVVADIQEKLGFRKPNVFQQSFTRSNLAYVVRHEEGKEEKLVEILNKVAGSGVVYARNRKKTKDLALMLQRKGISADFYHAGLEGELRSQKQDAWIAGKTRIMVSTNAFGMGIDKPDVRTVVHTDLPDSLEAYFQEAGRAGRDGKKSYAVLLYNDSDRRNLERNFELSYPPMEYIRQVYRALGSYYQLALGSGQGESYDFDITRFCENFKLEPARTYSCLKILEQAGWLTLTEAVWSPSALLLTADKEAIYDYMLRQPKLDAILKSILRSYQGAFQHHINIKEEQLARFLNIPAEEVIKALELMAKENILEYQPRKDKPQIVFLLERVDPANLTIDMELYQFRKQRQEKRIRSAVAYATDDECRSKMLLAYFGETDSRPCGVCDVCLERKKQALSTTLFEQIKNKMKEALTGKPDTLKNVLALFPPSQKEEVANTLEYLLDEGFLIEEEELLHWND
ncbi:MAG: RecQ family ATP-dependent DNA helicase [Saprospiraceae bacterium]|nr:RecQ family ATP-dependent DNA helicase [Saprospiraceae bacterium]